MKTKVCMASPAEPSGASWLINCFLELNVKVSHKPVVDSVWRNADPSLPPDHMWRQAQDGSYRLHPKAHVLKKWLPALTRIESFFFREDIEVEYVQDLPTPRQSGQPVLFFVRDPRDSLYSMYRRIRPALGYEAFLRFPDPDTLFDRPTHWRVFVESWLAFAGDNWFTFEAYKQDAAALLRRVLGGVGQTCGEEEIESAVLESSFDKARAAEERYKTDFPGDSEVANRAGRAGDWVDHTEARTGSALIESRAGDLMRRLGYDCPMNADGVPSYGPARAQRLPLCSQIRSPESVTARLTDNRLQHPLLDEVFAFLAEMDEALLRSTNLPSYRIRRLLDSLSQVACAERWDVAENIGQLRERFGEGSDHHFAQMRDLLIRRRRAKRHEE